MQADNIKDIIKDALDLANEASDAGMLRLGIERIAMRLSQLAPADAEGKQCRKPRMPVIVTHNGAVLAYNADTPELPRLTAVLTTECADTDHAYQSVDIYADKVRLAELNIYRGRYFAIRMVKAALKGAMSRLGHHRRQTANRNKRKAENAGKEQA